MGLFLLILCWSTSIMCMNPHTPDPKKPVAAKDKEPLTELWMLGEVCSHQDPLTVFHKARLKAHENSLKAHENPWARYPYPKRTWIKSADGATRLVNEDTLPLLERRKAAVLAKAPNPEKLKSKFEMGSLDTSSGKAKRIKVPMTPLQDPEVVKRISYGALCEAIVEQDKDRLEALVTARADFTQKGHKGNTILHYATYYLSDSTNSVHRRMFALVFRNSLLVLREKNEEGLTAFQVAQKIENNVALQAFAAIGMGS